MIKVQFNPKHWFFKHAQHEHVEALMQEEATIIGYLPSFKIIIYELSSRESAGMKVWNMGGRTKSHTHYSESIEQMPFIVELETLEAAFKTPKNDVGDLDPADVDTSKHFWDTYGKSETESYMRWLIMQCQEQGHFSTGIKSKGASSDLCLEGLLTDMGGGTFLPTRKAIRKLAGAGYWKPLQ